MKQLDESLFSLGTFTHDVLLRSRLWLSDPDIKRGMDISFDIDPVKQETWFNSLHDRSDYKIWAFYYGVIPIGAGGFRNITQDRAELTCYIGEKEYWGGTGRILVSHLLSKAKDLGYKNIYLRVLHDNERAFRCYLKCGFKVVSMDDKFKTLKYSA